MTVLYVYVLPWADDVEICLPFLPCSYTILRTITHWIKMIYCTYTILLIARTMFKRWLSKNQGEPKSVFWMHFHYCVIILIFTRIMYTSPYFRGRQRDPEDSFHFWFIFCTSDEQLLMDQLHLLIFSGSCHLIVKLIDRIL